MTRGNHTHILILAVTVAGMCLLGSPEQLRAQCRAGTCTTVQAMVDLKQGNEKEPSTSLDLMLDPPSAGGSLSKGDTLEPKISLAFRPDVENLWIKVKMDGDTQGEVVMGPGGPYTLVEDFGLLMFQVDPGTSSTFSSHLKAGSFMVRWKHRWLTIKGTEIVIAGDSDGTDSVYVKEGCISLSEPLVTDSEMAEFNYDPDKTPCYAQVADTAAVDSLLLSNSLPTLRVADLALSLDDGRVRRISDRSGIDRLTSLLQTMNHSIWPKWYDPVLVKLAVVVGGGILIGGTACVIAGCFDGEGTSTGSVVVTWPD